VAAGGRGRVKRHLALACGYIGNYNAERSSLPIKEGFIINEPQPPIQPPAIRAKIVRVGNSVGIRLPASLHFELGTQVEVIVRPVDAWPPGYAEQEAVDASFEVPERESGKAQEQRLKRLFGQKGGL